MTAAPWGWLPRHRGALASRRAVTGPFRARGFELAHRRRRRATTDHRGGRTRGSMKRDMELYRKILREVETWPTTCSPKEVEIEGFTQDQIGYHAWMLAEEGLLDGLDMTGADYPVHVYSPRCLTPKGHDFLETVREEDKVGTYQIYRALVLLCEAERDVQGVGRFLRRWAQDGPMNDVFKFEKQRLEDKFRRSFG